jgi:hypothetical protein
MIPRSAGSGAIMSDQARWLRMRDTGLAVCDALARRGVSDEESIAVLCAILARKTMDKKRQDQWPGAAVQTMETLHRHMSAEVRRLGVVLAEMPPGGHA